MSLIRRILFIVLLLMTGVTPVFAGAREDRAYGVACAEFKDKFYDLAETALTQFLQDYRKSTNAAQATLMLAQAQFYQGKYPDAISRLTEVGNLAKARAAGIDDRYLYWAAEARFAADDLSGSAAALVAVANQFPKSPLAVKAVVEAASIYGRLGKWKLVDGLLGDTNGVFRRAAMPGSSAEVSILASGWLLQAEARLMQQDFDGAIGVLKRLDGASLSLEQKWNREHLLVQACEGRHDLDSALAVATNLLAVARQGHGDIWAANYAESVVLYAGLLQQDGRPGDALSAWKENLTSNAPVEQQQQAIFKVVELAAANNNLTEAEDGLEKFLDQFPLVPTADMALLTLGELHLTNYLALLPGTNDQLAIAQEKFDQFIGGFTNSALIGKAYLDRGWCFWLKSDYHDSLADFQAATRSALGSNELAVARFKAGDSAFALGRFKEAINDYEAVMNGFPAVPGIANGLGAAALYQILRAQLELHEIAGLSNTMSLFLEKYASSVPSDGGLLLAGQGFASFGDPALAREVFLKFERERTHSSLLPQVKFAVGRTFEREQQWLAAATNYEAWLAAYPTNELRPQVEYAHDWAVSQSGDEAGAFLLFTNYISEYTNKLTSLARWWVADHYFRQGTNDDLAELNYQLILQEFKDSPASELAAQAYLMAAQAAMRRGNYNQAVSLYLTRLMTNNMVASNLRDQARLAFAEARRLTFSSSSDTNYQDFFGEVTNVLAEMYPETLTNITGALAWCETGDCDKLMGDLNGATNAYAQVITAPPASEELRNRAQVGLGLVLEKKAEALPPDLKQPLLLLAFNQYADVFYNTNGFSDPFWIKAAALRALPLMPQLQKDNVDRFASSIAFWLPSMRETLEKKREALKH